MAKRGSAVIKARGGSSAASAANAVIDSVRALHVPTAAGDWFSSGRGLRRQLRHPRRLIYSFPLVSKGHAAWSIVPGVPIDAEARARLDASAAELVSERDAVKELLGPAAMRPELQSSLVSTAAAGPMGRCPTRALGSRPMIRLRGRLRSTMIGPMSVVSAEP